LTDLST